MQNTSDNSTERLLKEIEESSKKYALRLNRRFIVRSWIIKLKLFIIRNTGKTDIEIDRKILLLLSREVFIKGNTPEAFQNKLYEFLDYCKEKKSEKEFKTLINLFNSTFNSTR